MYLSTKPSIVVSFSKVSSKSQSDGEDEGEFDLNNDRRKIK